MNYIPFIVAGLLLAGGFGAGGAAVYVYVDEGEDHIEGGYGDQPLEVEIIENYGDDYASFTPFTIQLQSYVANGDGNLYYAWQWDDSETILSVESNLIFEVSPHMPGGLHTISLTVTDEDGDTGSDTFTLEVGAPADSVTIIDVGTGNEFPEDDLFTPYTAQIDRNDLFIFAFPRVDGPPPVEVSFSAALSGLFCMGFGWDFGDGSEDYTGSTTSHIYQSSGEFHVTLNAIYPGEVEGTSESEMIGEVDVIILDHDPVDPVTVDMDIPDFPEDAPRYVMDLTIHADPVQGLAPLYVNFNTNIAPTVTTGFLWNFDDGGPVSFERGPSHIFIEPGLYHVTVAYSSGYGGYGYGEIDIFVEGPPNELIVEIEVIPTEWDRTYELIAHTNIEAELNFDWTFLHGPPDSGWRTLHTFDVFGMNYAEVHVYNEDLDLYAMARVDIYIPHFGAPDVHFLIHPSPNDPAYYQFEPIVSGETTSYSYFWHFGDGASSSEEYPTHYYEDSGYYKVELFIEDGEGRVGYYFDYLLARSIMGGEF